MAKKLVPVRAAGGVIKKKKPVTSSVRVMDSNLSVKNDCTCATMAPHCPIHAVRRIPAPGCDVIR
jgi:hypothetical protein